MTRSTISEPNFKRAVAAAYRVRLKYDPGGWFLAFDPFLPITMARNLQIIRYDTFCKMHRIEYLEFMRGAASSDGMIWRKDGRYKLLYNDAPYIPATRKRFTVAHELGHYVLKHISEGEKEEQEANCFARNLLAPRLLAIERGIEFRDYPKVFGISAAAARMCYRFREMDEALALDVCK